MEIWQILREHTAPCEAEAMSLFERSIERLYTHLFFKRYLDVIISIAKQGKVKFELPKNTKNYHPLEGCCESAIHQVYHPLLKRFVQLRSYKIMIRNINPEVIIHEWAHALETESKIDLSLEFMSAITADLEAKRSSNITIAQAIHTIFFKELQHYSPKQQASEWFARYFQLYAMTKEIAGYETEYGFHWQDIEGFFVHTRAWVRETLDPLLEYKIDPKIAENSESLLAKHTQAYLWQDAVKSFHGKTVKMESAPPKWRKSVKSMLHPGEEGS